uniref:Uncharacterized protein n=1 Tax=Arundo donax TaxID=35708 RepID=A0A0A9H2A3_ARUDO
MRSSPGFIGMQQSSPPFTLRAATPHHGQRNPTA